MKSRVRNALMCLAIAPLILAFDSVTTAIGAQTTRTFLLPAYLHFIDESQPTWRLTVAPEQLDRQPVLLREGDRVTIAFEDYAKTKIAEWSQRYRHYSHETCRTRWFRRKCTRHYKIYVCNIPYWQNPVDGALRIIVTLEPDGAPGTVGPEDKLSLGGGVHTVNRFLDGPRWLRFSGMFTMEKPACKNARGSKHGELVLKHALGQGGLRRWFSLRVSVEAPELD